MNLFQLVIKQMRQRALSTWLTLLSVMLGVALAVVIMLIQRESAKLFGQTDYGFDVLVGAKGSPLQLVLNTVYHIDRSPGNIPYSLYKDLSAGGKFFPLARTAIPIAVGDNYKSHRIVGTSPRLFGFDEDGVTRIAPDRAFEYRPGRKYQIAEGKLFHPKRFEAVIGAEISKLTGLKIGDKFRASHGLAETASPDEHNEEWKVTGILAPTQTAADRVLYIPLISFYAMSGHGDAMTAQSAIRQGADIATLNKPTTVPDDEEHHGGLDYTVNNDGDITINLPEKDLALSAVLVKTRGSAHAAFQLMYAINNGNTAAAVNPASVMREFFNTFLKPTTAAWGAVAYLVNLVAIVAILVSIYNSVSARMREVAILRALGATRRRILSIICLEAGLIGLVGALLGLAIGHGLGFVASGYLERSIGETLRWWIISPMEWWYVGGVALVAVLAGLVPALKAYRTSVAENLVAA